jgi:hypothetical protein
MNIATTIEVVDLLTIREGIARPKEIARRSYDHLISETNPSAVLMDPSAPV